MCENNKTYTPRELLYEFTKDKPYSYKSFIRNLGWIPRLGKQFGWDTPVPYSKIKNKINKKP